MDYLDELVGRLKALLGERLVAVWQVGSGALDDFDPQRSDIDVQALSSERLPVTDRRAVAAALFHEALPVPARGLEFVLYAREDLADARFSLNLNTGPEWEHQEDYDPQTRPRFWFVLDLAIARQSARPLYGEFKLPELSETQILDALDESLEWWREFGGREAMLAGCRTLAWLETGRWLSKSAAQARTRDPHDPAFLDRVATALSARRGR